MYVCRYVCVYIRSSQKHFLDNDVAATKLHISVTDFLDCTDFHRLNFLGIHNIISGFPFWKKIAGKHCSNSRRPDRSR